MIKTQKNFKKLLEEFEEAITTSASIDQGKKINLFGLIEKLEESIYEKMRIDAETDSKEEDEIGSKGRTIEGHT